VCNKNNELPIYPSYLELIKSNDSERNVNFLDLNISIDNNNKIITNIFDKRNEFNFEIVKFQRFNSCLHKQVFKNIILSQIIRINRLCSPNVLKLQLNKLKEQLLKYGYNKNLVLNIIDNFKFK